jgi:hypothetical protein
LAFFDAGLAWFGGQDVRLRGDSGNLRDPSVTRSLLRSYGFGVRVNLYGFALLRWDYAIPLDGPSRKQGYWRFSLGPSFSERGTRDARCATRGGRRRALRGAFLFPRAAVGLRAQGLIAG